MTSEYKKPETVRGKLVFFFWNNLPRFILLVMAALIIILSMTVSEQKSAIKAEQDAAAKAFAHVMSSHDK